MKKIIFAVVAVLFSGAISAQATLETLNTKFTDAAAAVKAKDLDKAITLFEQVISEGANVANAEAFVSGAKQYLPQMMFARGGTQFQAGNLDAALADFSKAAETAELYGNVSILNNARTWISRTVTQQAAEAFNSKDYATAAAIFQKGYDSNPNDTGVALNLALSYSEMGDYAKGNGIYKNVIALEGRSARLQPAVDSAKTKMLYYARLRVSEAGKAKNYDGVIVAAEDYLAQFPADAEFSMTRLQAYNNKKDYSKVIELGDATIHAQHNHEAKMTAQYMVAAAYQNTENYPKAIEYYRHVTSGQYAASARAQIAELQKAIK